jgi:hypothetical protein
MIHRRGVLPVLALLALVAIGVVFQIVRGAGAPARPAQDSGHPVPAAATGEASAVLRSLGAVEGAYEAGDARRLCRPGALVDPAVVGAQDAKRPECKAELESLMSRVSSLRPAVRDIALRPDLATLDVSVAGAASVPVDFVRLQGRWLLSFSDGEDPMRVLAGAG